MKKTYFCEITFNFGLSLLPTFGKHQNLYLSASNTYIDNWSKSEDEEGKFKSKYFHWLCFNISWGWYKK